MKKGKGRKKPNLFYTAEEQEYEKSWQIDRLMISDTPLSWKPRTTQKGVSLPHGPHKLWRSKRHTVTQRENRSWGYLGFGCSFCFQQRPNLFRGMKVKRTKKKKFRKQKKRKRKKDEAFLFLLAWLVGSCCLSARVKDRKSWFSLFCVFVSYS